MSTHNICFYEEISKFSGNYHKIPSLICSPGKKPAFVQSFKFRKKIYNKTDIHCLDSAFVNLFEPLHDKANKMACAHTED